ncbi:MAG: 50S ribosomal protein L23 [Lachnospiraceae bacterium]|nr:50S ribosomal protein L23 [Lachnospiraceae bacterium]
MADLKYYDVILKPVVTEKSMNAMAEKKYTFLVHPDANKVMIAEAVEKMFPGTKVASVNTMNLDGKTRRRTSARGQIFGKTAKMKKAIVKLTADSAEIEVFQGL